MSKLIPTPRIPTSPATTYGTASRAAITAIARTAERSTGPIRPRPAHAAQPTTSTAHAATDVSTSPGSLIATEATTSSVASPTAGP